MILIKGNNIKLELDNNQGWITPPASYGIIHDPENKYLPKCVVFVGPYKKSNISLSHDRHSEEYFGKSYIGHDATISIPSGSWKHIGEVVQIWYKRPGKYHAKYYHFFKGSTKVTLWKLKNYYKLGLHNGCIVNWRGFVYP